MIFLWSVLSNLTILNFHCLHLFPYTNLYLEKLIKVDLLYKEWIVNVLDFVAI